jgi:hypothetical protein
MNMAIERLNSLDPFAEQAIKQPAMGQLASAVNIAEEAARKVAEMTTHLCGAVPATQAGNDKHSADGLFDEVEVLAARLTEYARSIIDDISRVQNRL